MGKDSKSLGCLGSWLSSGRGRFLSGMGLSAVVFLLILVALEWNRLASVLGHLGDLLGPWLVGEWPLLVVIAVLLVLLLRSRNRARPREAGGSDLPDGALKTAPDLWKKLSTKPYETLSDRAEVVKALLQMVVGIFLVFSVLNQLIASAFGPFVAGGEAAKCSGPGLIGFWCGFSTKILLDSIGDALLVATAIELAYMLFTKGPDEAVNPPLMALAAAILLTLGNVDGIQPNATRALEIIVYVAAIAVLLWLRKKYNLDQDKTKPKIIKTDAEYAAALARWRALTDAAPGSPEEEERQLFAMLIKQYKKKRQPIEQPAPADAIR